MVYRITKLNNMNDTKTTNTPEPEFKRLYDSFHETIYGQSELISQIENKLQQIFPMPQDKTNSLEQSTKSADSVMDHLWQKHAIAFENKNRLVNILSRLDSLV